MEDTQSVEPALKDESGKGGKKRKKKDFSNPKKLGFMRVIMYCYAAMMLFTVTGMALTSRDAITYDLNTIMLFLDTVLAGISIWLLVKRMKMARWALIIMNLIDILAVFILLATGALDASEIQGNVIISAAIIIYMATSRRAKAVLTNTFSNENIQETTMATPREWVFWRNLILFYCIFSLVGHWMEAGFCMLIRWGVVAGSYDPSNTSLWRDWLYPFPPDGVGFAMCVLLLYPLKNWLQEHISIKWLPLVISFVINALVCTLVELSFGLIVNQQHQLWDYSDMFGNFIGQVCLQNSIGFGVVSTIATWAIYPFLAGVIRKIPKNIMNFIFFAFIVFYALLQALYLVNLPNLG